MLKIVSAALRPSLAWTFEAKAKDIKTDFEAPRGKGLVSRTISLGRRRVFVKPGTH